MPSIGMRVPARETGPKGPEKRVAPSYYWTRIVGEHDNAELRPLFSPEITGTKTVKICQIATPVGICVLTRSHRLLDPPLPPPSPHR